MQSNRAAKDGSSMSDAKTADEIKRRGAINNSENDEFITSTLVTELKPDIFRLHVDCFDEIFEFLTLPDLYSFGQTCKAMQQVAGVFFQRNFKSSKIAIKHDSLRLGRVKLDGFSEFVEKLWMDGGIEDFHFAGAHCNGAIKEIYFDLFSLNEAKIACIKPILAKVEIILLTDCIIQGDFHENFLKLCPNLKRLSVGCYEGFQNQWLFQKYPKLEYLKLSGDVSFQCNDLKMFFHNNPNVQSLAIDGSYLLKNRHLFLEAELKWYDLTCSLAFNYADNMNQYLIVFKELHERGVYQRLQLFLNGREWDETFLQQLAVAPRLVNLCLDYLKDSNIKCAIDLRKLEVFIPLNVRIDALEILAKNLVNLERIVFRAASFSQILPFIHQSRKLKEVRVCLLTEGMCFNRVLNLLELNNQREKLNGAQKVTIYVEEKVFLATKWAAVKINFHLIEMKRLSSYQDNSSYATFI